MVNGTLILRDGKPPYDYFTVIVKDSGINGALTRVSTAWLRKPSAPFLTGFLYSGDILVIYRFVPSKSSTRPEIYRTSLDRKKPLRFIGRGTLYGGTIVSAWSIDNAFAILKVDNHGGFNGLWPHLFDAKRNVLTPLPNTLSGFFWHPRSDEPAFRYLICQALREVRKDEKGNPIRNDDGELAIVNRGDFSTGEPRYNRLRIGDDGKPLPLEPLSDSDVDRLVGPTYRKMTAFPTSIGSIPDLRISPDGRTSVESGLLRLHPTPYYPDNPVTPEQDPMTDKDKWMYRVCHDGRLAREQLVRPQHYIWPICWSRDSKYLIGFHDYNDLDTRRHLYNRVVTVEPLTWRVRTLYQPPKGFEVVDFFETA